MTAQVEARPVLEAIAATIREAHNGADPTDVVAAVGYLLEGGPVTEFTKPEVANLVRMGRLRIEALSPPAKVDGKPAVWCGNAGRVPLWQVSIARGLLDSRKALADGSVYSTAYRMLAGAVAGLLPGDLDVVHLATAEGWHPLCGSALNAASVPKEQSNCVSCPACLARLTGYGMLGNRCLECGAEMVADHGTYRCVACGYSEVESTVGLT